MSLRFFLWELILLEHKCFLVLRIVSLVFMFLYVVFGSLHCLCRCYLFHVFTFTPCVCWDFDPFEAYWCWRFGMSRHAVRKRYCEYIFFIPIEEDLNYEAHWGRKKHHTKIIVTRDELGIILKQKRIGTLKRERIVYWQFITEYVL